MSKTTLANANVRRLTNYPEGKAMGDAAGWRAPEHARLDGQWSKPSTMQTNLTTSAIATALGVSWVYASHIRACAKRPHPRHWVKLAELVGIFGNQMANP